MNVWDGVTDQIIFTHKRPFRLYKFLETPASGVIFFCNYFFF